MNNTKIMSPNDYFFGVCIPPNVGDMEPPAIAMVEKDFYINTSGGLDDSFGSHSLPQNVIDALNRAGICGMESIWEVIDYTRTKQDIIDSLTSEGFVYSADMDY